MEKRHELELEISGLVFKIASTEEVLITISSHAPRAHHYC